MAELRQALSAGSGRLLAWSDLLDEINVFPVADGDTGRNLVLSLSPLRDAGQPAEGLVERLLMEARGNSGNIAARFLSGLLEEGNGGGLHRGVALGRERAWKAVAHPMPGTMLSLFDGLAAGLESLGDVHEASAGARDWADELLDRLEEAVATSRDLLPELRQAGVVDAGALGMYLFFEGFLQRWVGEGTRKRSVVKRFGDGLRLGEDYQAEPDEGHCVDLVLRARGEGEPDWSGLGESVVSLRQGELIKVHLHTDDLDGLRARVEERGEVLRFSSDDLHDQTREARHGTRRRDVHLVTDAAGSLSRADARRLGFSLLNSYVLLGKRSIPETYLAAEELYRAMAQGVPVATSQASVFERQQHLSKALELHERVLYLCVGSVYTGNHAAALQFKQEHDPEDRLVVIDSQAASGRLGLMALDLAREIQAGRDVESLLARARRLPGLCRELIFLDQLKYLAAGGRLSKTSAFFGDLLRVKPVVSPQADGAKKVGALRRREDQLPFAEEYLAEHVDGERPGRMLLQYCDNRARVEEEILPRLRERFAGVDMELHAMSLTSGAHMGPGTWAVAYLPGSEDES